MFLFQCPFCITMSPNQEDMIQQEKDIKNILLSFDYNLVHMYNKWDSYIQNDTFYNKNYAKNAWFKLNK